LAFRQETREVSLCVDADRVAGNDHELAGERVGDLVYDALQHGKPEREDDGIGALQRFAVARGDDRLRNVRTQRLITTQEAQSLLAKGKALAGGYQGLVSNAMPGSGARPGKPKGASLG
jgi:hypothetical protein